MIELNERTSAHYIGLFQKAFIARYNRTCAIPAVLEALNVVNDAGMLCDPAEFPQIATCRWCGKKIKRYPNGTMGERWNHLNSKDQLIGHDCYPREFMAEPE